MQIVANFGKISGLQVQPTKSQLIFLNTAVNLEDYEGIPVLAHGDTVRYLGYAVGTGTLTNANWAERIRGIQRRLATATQVATSIENRVTLLNVIMLPSVLFTAAVFDVPNWAVTQLVNIQKQFLWQHATGTEASRHKISPGLVYAPKAAGGVGLASIPLACKTQRVKHAMIWLIQKKDRYFAAWKAWMFRGARLEMQTGLTPCKTLARQPNRSSQTPGKRLLQLIGEWVQPRVISTGAEIEQYREDMSEFELESISWHVRDEWIIELPRELPPPRLEFTAEEKRFWPTYRWCNNPWILDREGRMLTAAKFDKIHNCVIGDLRIKRTGATTFSMQIPVNGQQLHQHAKLRRWGLAILLNSSSLEIDGSLTVQRDIEPRHMMKLENEYRWEVSEAGTVTGTVTSELGRQYGHLELEQQDDGLRWRVKEQGTVQRTVATDQKKLQRRQHYGSIVFYAHPRCHGIPWSVSDSIANQHVGKVLKKQPFKRFKGEVIRLDTVLDGLHRIVQSSPWQAAALDQTPKQVWAHRNELTAYQVWVAYRVSVRQLNLYHEGRRQDNSCRKLAACQGRKETMEHIFWECGCARATWRLVIAQWTEEQWTEEGSIRLRSNCASRQPPQLSKSTRQWIQRVHPDEEQEYAAEWKRIWRILASVSLASLWMQRNKVIFQHEDVTEVSSTEESWAIAVRQLHALAKRERSQPDKQEQGIRLLLCLRVLEDRPREHPSTGLSPVQSPD